MIFLLGATATGKTELGAALATHYDAELIGVDAAQVYRTMNIGAGKPCAEFLRRHPHHLIDIREPHQPYCAAQFCRDALTAIRAIHARGKLPILLGGTMFYFSALENGLATLPSADATVRAQIAREFAQLGAHAMHAKLARIDARTAARIRPSDRQRIGRALEIYALSQRAPSALIDDAQGAHHAFDFPIIKLGLFVAERSALHAAIEARFAQMLDAGLLDEVETIVANLHAAFDARDAQDALDAPDTFDIDSLPALRAVGYRQVLQHLRGACDYSTMRAQAIAATRQLAKRQLTWMRRFSNLAWLAHDTARAHPPPLDLARTYIDARLAQLQRR